MEVVNRTEGVTRTEGVNRTERVTTTEGIAAAVVPTATARATLHPLGLGQVRLQSGLLHERQTTNRRVTLLHGHHELERAGTLQNFRIAAGQADGERVGMVFSDSDVYKWLEALAWEIGRERSEELERLAEETIALVAAAQEPDGYLNTYAQVKDPSWRFTDLEMGHELYCAGHLFQAAVAFARATGDEALLGVARRLADLIDDTFRLGDRTETDGHPEIETALVELYRVTGEPRYLELSKTLTGRRGQRRFGARRFYPEYYQDATPVREARAIVGHAVRALYLLSGITDLYAETGEAQLLESAVAQWEDMTAGKMYLTGGVGSRHFGEAFGEQHELPPDRAYCETCAAIASMMWNWRLLLATGEARYADLFERTLYNGFLAGTSRDGDRFFYVNPLQSRGGHDPRAAWDPVACCPPNIMRMYSSIQQYLATADESGLQVHQYAGAEIRAGAIGVRIRTEFPFGGRIEVEVTESEGEWTLALRIPQWASEATVDGDAAQAGGYTRLSRRWRAGEKVIVELGLTPRLTAPNPRIDAVRGCLAIERGPLVYCIERADAPEAVAFEDLRLAAGHAPADADTAAPGLEGVPAVTLAAKVEENGGTDAYRVAGSGNTTPEPANDAQALQILAVPYFAWGHRGTGPMRVWIPAGQPN